MFPSTVALDADTCTHAICEAQEQVGANQRFNYTPPETQKAVKRPTPQPGRLHTCKMYKSEV